MFDKLFGNIGDIGNAVQVMVNNANQHAEANRQLTEVTQQQTAAVADSAARYNQEAQNTLGELKGVQAAGEKARALAESDNIFDRITLVGEQILNPREYTREGRSNRMSEMSQELALQGQILNVEATNADAQIQNARATAAVATAETDAQMAAMRATVDGLQLMTQGLVATETMRRTAMSQMELPELQKILSGPAKGGLYEVGGMKFSQVELKERANNLEIREQIAALPLDVQSPELANAQKIQQNLALGTMSITDLEELKANGYVFNEKAGRLAGQQVTPQLWDEHWSRQNTMAQESLQRTMNQSMLENQVPVMMEEGSRLMQNVQKYATPGTPLAAAVTNYRAQMGTLAQLSAQGVTPEKVQPFMNAMQVAQEKLIKGVTAEAKRKAGGDEALASIYADQMLGTEIPAAKIEDLTRERYVKGKGFGDYLPTDASRRIRAYADQRVAELNKQNAQNAMDVMADKKSDKEIKEQAINEAMEMERNRFGNEAINGMQSAVAQRSDNPAVQAGMVPASIREMEIRASTAAWADVAERFDLDESKITALKAGRWKDVGISDTQAAEYNGLHNELAVVHEYNEFDRQKPGLGYDMQQYYMKTLPEMARNYTSSLDPMQAGIAQDAALVEAQRLAHRWVAADEGAMGRSQAVAAEMATGAKRPENMWPVLLHTSSNLSESQKSTIYFDIIAPALKTVRTNGANDQVASDAVFQALNDFKSGDVTLMKALKQFQTELPVKLDNFNTMWDATLANSTNRFKQAMVIERGDRNTTKRIRQVIPWLVRD